MDNERLVAVVVTHNRLDQLKFTIARLLETSEQDLSAVVVINNASTDQTREWLSGLQNPRIEPVHCDANLGGAGGFEAGVAHAMTTFSPDWILLMDDDARPFHDALHTFHSTTRSRSTVQASAVYYPDGRICEMNRPSENPFWRFAVFARTLRSMLMGRIRSGYHLPDEAYLSDQCIEIDLSSFVGMFVSREIVQKVGLPDGRLFIYGDDGLYALRLRKAGFRIEFDPNLKFEHDCQTYEDDQIPTFRPVWKVYYNYRNSYFMYRRAAGVAFWFLLPVLLLKWHRTSRHYGAERERHNRLMRHAIWDAMRGALGRSHKDVLKLSEA